MNSSWTWRQYAIFRTLLGVYLLIHFVHLVPWGPELFSSIGMLADAEHSPLIRLFPNLLRWFDSPAVVTGLLVLGAGAALLLIVGRFDRSAALAMWFLLACLFGRNPLIANPSMPVVGWLLLFHALLPRRHEPWGASKDNGATTLPAVFVTLAWFMLAVAYGYSGWTKLFSEAWVQGETVRWVLENPLARATGLRGALLATPAWLLQSVTVGILGLELLFAPLALVRRARPWIWLGMLLVQFGFLVLLDFADLTTPMLLLHLLTFDPAWLLGRGDARSASIYYDGDCGFCHASIKFVLAEDRGAVFQFAPMQGRTAEAFVPDVANQIDYESLVVVTDNGERLEKFRASRYILLALGGLWGVAGKACCCVPHRIGDALYTLVARNRRRLFPAPPGLCPVLPESVAARFAL